MSTENLGYHSLEKVGAEPLCAHICSHNQHPMAGLKRVDRFFRLKDIPTTITRTEILDRDYSRDFNPIFTRIIQRF